MREWMQMLVKRRGQHKQVIIEMINLTYNEILPKIVNREEKMLLLSTLRETTEGRMFCEREYASCTKKLVEMNEQDGKIDEATKMIQEI